MNAGASTSGASSGSRPCGPAVRRQRARMQPDLVGHRDERQLDELAEDPQQHLVARRPPHAGLLAHRRVEQARGDPSLRADHRLEQLIPDRRRHQHEPRLGDADGEDVEGRAVDLQLVAALGVPVLAELLPGLGNRPHAHAVHPVPLHVLVEQLALLGLGQSAAEVFGGLDDQHEEGRVRPVERLGIQRVVAPALGVDALDGVVVALDLRAGLRGAITVVDHAHDRVDRAGHPLQRLAQQDRVIFDAGAEFGVHVLDRADPDAEHAGPQVAEVLPRQ